MNATQNTPAIMPAEKQPLRRYAWLLTAGFLLYTAIMLLGHIAGFPLSYVYLQTVCKTNCEAAPALSAANVAALARIGISITLYANVYIAIQTIYILACIGVAVFIVMKKPGQLVPLGVGLLLVGLSGYEGANYPDEIDLEHLSQHLVAVVKEAMQPTQVTLWLRAPQGEKQEEQA